jgi:hypothetical protein
MLFAEKTTLQRSAAVRSSAYSISTKSPLPSHDGWPGSSFPLASRLTVHHPGRQERTSLTERRAVFVTIPPLLSDILVEVASQGTHHLRLIAQIEREALTEQLPLLAPDIVLIGLRSGETDEIGSVVLKLVPGAKVLVLSNDGHDAYLHEMHAHRALLRNFSAAHLLAVLEGSGSALPC